jgi:hypothetical protein
MTYCRDREEVHMRDCTHCGVTYPLEQIGYDGLCSACRTDPARLAAERRLEEALERDRSRSPSPAGPAGGDAPEWSDAVLVEQECTAAVRSVAEQGGDVATVNRCIVAIRTRASGPRSGREQGEAGLIVPAAPGAVGRWADPLLFAWVCNCGNPLDACHADVELRCGRCGCVRPAYVAGGDGKEPPGEATAECDLGPAVRAISLVVMWARGILEQQAGVIRTARDLADTAAHLPDVVRRQPDAVPGPDPCHAPECGARNGDHVCWFPPDHDGPVHTDGKVDWPVEATAVRTMGLEDLVKEGRRLARDDAHVLRTAGGVRVAYTLQALSDRLGMMTGVLEAMSGGSVMIGGEYIDTGLPRFLRSVEREDLAAFVEKELDPRRHIGSGG